MSYLLRSFKHGSPLFCYCLAFASLTLQGCLGVKSYVDPALPVVKVAALKPNPNPQPVCLVFEFQTNGKPNKRATKEVLPKITQALESSRLFASLIATNQQGATSTPRLSLVLNNQADIGSAVGKGVGTGLTFGTAGSLVTDGYVFNATFERLGHEPIKREYRHAIHSTVGNKKGPAGLQPVDLNEAIDIVVEQLVFNLLKDLQSAAEL
jgi:hypothetical protein